MSLSNNSSAAETGCDAEEKSAAAQNVFHRFKLLACAKAKTHYNIFLVSLCIAFVFCGLCFALLQFGTQTVSSRDLVVHSSCVRQKNYLVCHAETCTLKGSCRGSSRSVEFSSVHCADQVQAVTVHEAGNTVKHYPAYYLRVRNTSKFRIDGKRAIFAPVPESCQATSRPREAEKIQTALASELRGSVVWVSSKEHSTYSVFRDEKLLAQMDHNMVLVEQVSKSHFVYRLHVPCHEYSDGYEEGRITVYGQTNEKKEKVKTFDYCD